MKSSKSRNQRKYTPLPPVSLGITAKENLPFPIVHYPGHYGTFITFSQDYNTPSYFCSCARPLLENYLKLMAIQEYEPTESFVPVKIDNYEFPQDMAARLQGLSDPHRLASLFESGLCHRCNMSSPSVRWCHEMYGVSFVQYFGWYINQNYLRLGIFPGISKHQYLKDICPENIQNALNNAESAETNLRIYQQNVLKSLGSMKPLNNDFNAPSENDEKILDNEKRFQSLSRDATRLRRIVTNIVENLTRTEFGFRKIGEHWVNETLLFNIINRLFPDKSIIRHYRPKWLEKLELDIFIPDLKLAIEYQGQQHYFPIPAWGGDSALLNVQERDRRKALLCQKNDVRLITVDFTEPLTEDYIQRKLIIHKR